MAGRNMRKGPVTFNGVVLPVISGGADDGPPAADPLAPVSPPAAPAQAARTFTQQEHEAILEREKRQGHKAGESAVTELLGMAPAEAKKILDDIRAAEQAAMSEAERKLVQAADRERQATIREAQATTRERRADIRAALADASVPSNVASRLMSLVELELGENPADADHIAAAIEAVKADLPAVFAPPAAVAPAVTPPPNGDPRGKPPAGGQPPVDQIKAQNERRLAERGLLKPVANQSA